MRNRFDRQLSQLHRELIELGALCEEIIASAAKALLDNDKPLAAAIPAISGEIDRKERTIEALCLRLLLQQQPVARDLRQISAALKMITDMERIGDQAADIAEIVMTLTPRGRAEYHLLGDMARATIRMVTESVDAYVKRDTDMAQAVVDYDDVVDTLFLRVRAALAEMIAGTSSDGAYAIDLLMIAKYFERIGDHAVNIAQWVVFSVTGVHKDALAPETLTPL